MNLKRKAVHQTRMLDPLVVEPGNELAELLLGGDDHPVLATAPHAEVLHDRLQVEHLLDVTRDELAHLVHHEHEGTPGLPKLHELAGALCQFAWSDVCLILDGL